MTTMPQPDWTHNPASIFALKYDAWNRLVEVRDASSNLVQTNEYDGLGRRIVRVDAAANPDVTHHFYYNENWQLLEERTDSNTNPLNQFLWHPYYVDALAIRWYDANSDGSGIVDYYHLHDANFNVSAVVNSSGAVVERYHYWPYGYFNVMDASFNIISSTSIANTHYFTGRELDPETGLQLNRHRYYASHMGRWLTRDPIGYLLDDYNLYWYVDSQPTLFKDPYGLFWNELGHAIVGGIAGGMGGAFTGGVTGVVIGGTIGGVGGTVTVPGVGTGVGIVGGGVIGGIGGAIGGGIGGVFGGAISGWNEPGGARDAAFSGGQTGAIVGIGGGAAAVGGPVGAVVGGAIAGGASAGISTEGDPAAMAVGAIVGGGLGYCGCLAQQGNLGPIVGGMITGDAAIIGEDCARASELK